MKHTFTVQESEATGTTRHPVSLAHYRGELRPPFSPEGHYYVLRNGYGFTSFLTDPDPATTTPPEPETPEEPETPSTGSAFRVPFFSPEHSCIHAASDAQRCDNPTLNGFLHIVNRGTSAASVTIEGKDANGAGGTRTEAAIPAGGNRRVQDHVLEGATGFNHNGAGAWSLRITSTEPDVDVAAFSRFGDAANGFSALPVIRE